MTNVQVNKILPVNNYNWFVFRTVILPGILNWYEWENMIIILKKQDEASQK